MFLGKLTRTTCSSEMSWWSSKIVSNMWVIFIIFYHGLFFYTVFPEQLIEAFLPADLPARHIYLLLVQYFISLHSLKLKSKHFTLANPSVFRFEIKCCVNQLIYYIFCLFFRPHTWRKVMCPPLDSSSQPGSPLRYYGASVYFLLKETVSRNWINSWKLLIFPTNVQASKIPRTSVGNPDPWDPHVFGHPESGSLPFLINVSNALKQCLQNIILTQTFSNVFLGLSL
jgi:hypothetical protein